MKRGFELDRKRIDDLQGLSQQELGIMSVAWQGGLHPYEHFPTQLIPTVSNIEFTGMPRAFKTTIINKKLEEMKRRRIKIKHIKEQQVRFDREKNPVSYNLLFASKASVELVENEFRGRIGPRRVWMDRGIYNEIPFILTEGEEGVLDDDDGLAIKYFARNFGAYVDALVICDSTPELSMNRDPYRGQEGSEPGPIMNITTLTILRKYFKLLPETVAQLRAENALVSTPLVIAVLDSTVDFEAYSNLFSRTLNTLLKLSYF